jgi:hypothetical protein
MRILTQMDNIDILIYLFIFVVYLKMFLVSWTTSIEWFDNWRMVHMKRCGMKQL